MEPALQGLAADVAIKGLLLKCLALNNMLNSNDLTYEPHEVASRDTI